MRVRLPAVIWVATGRVRLAGSSDLVDRDHQALVVACAAVLQLTVDDDLFSKKRLVSGIRIRSSN